MVKKDPIFPKKSQNRKVKAPPGRCTTQVWFRLDTTMGEITYRATGENKVSFIDLKKDRVKIVNLLNSLDHIEAEHNDKRELIIRKDKIWNWYGKRDALRAFQEGIKDWLTKPDSVFFVTEPAELLPLDNKENEVPENDSNCETPRYRRAPSSKRVKIGVD